MAAHPWPAVKDKGSMLAALILAGLVAAAEPAATQGAGPVLGFTPKTAVDGATLQVVLGQRAVFRLDAKGLPVLQRVEDGKLSAAHPTGEVAETFEPPADGEIAAALDGSAERRATLLKIWNGTDKALDYRAIALVMQKDKLAAAPAPTCPVPAHGVRTETWTRPVVAVGLLAFQPVPLAPLDCR